MARPLAKNRDEKLNHILKTSARVFAETGISRSSMSEVAKACGIAKGSIYHYYESKEILIFDILDRYLEELKIRITQLNYEGMDGAAKLQMFCCELLLAYEGMDNEHKIQIEGISLLDHRQQKILKDHQRVIVGELSAILDSINPNTNLTKSRLRDATMAIFGMLNWYYIWNQEASQKERLSYANIVSEITMNGVYGLKAE